VTRAGTRSTAFWSTGLALAACYGSNGRTTDPTPSPYEDRDGDGAPDLIGPDPFTQDRCISCVDDNDADTIPDDRDVDDDNDGILDERPDAQLVDAVRPIAQAECEAVSRCCGEGWSEAAFQNCSIGTTGTLVVALAQGWSDGFVEVDQAGLDDCVAAQELDCDQVAPRLAPFRCGAYLAGLRGEQALCYRSVECSAGLFCAAEFPFAHEIVGPAPYRVTEAILPPELGAVCVPRADLGHACGSDGPACAEGLDCRPVHEGTCIVARPEGEVCTVSGDVARTDDCAAGLYCDDSSAPAACVRALEVAQPCLEDRQCASGRCDLRLQACDQNTSPVDACSEGRRYDPS
jgi:hypothetical protein